MAAVAAIALSAACGTAARAAAVLSVDMGSGTVQSGFTGWNVGADGTSPRTTTFAAADLTSVPSGTVSANLAARTNVGDTNNTTIGVNTRVRTAPVNAGAFTYADLLTDRVVTVDAAAEGLFLELSGFAPNTPFAVQVWGYDNAKAGNVDLRNRTNGANASLGTYAVTAGQTPTTNDSFSVTNTVTSDATGKIVLESLSNIDGKGIMNGFVVSTAPPVPEPSTAAAGLVAAGGLAALRRRRQRSA